MLLTKDSRKLADFIESKSNDVDSVLTQDYDKFSGTIAGLQKVLNEKYSYLITSDDKKIIDFIKEISKGNLEDFLEIIGMFYFITQAAKESLNLREGSENARLAILFWCFQSLYELILYVIDRRLDYYISTNKKTIGKDKSIDKFRAINRSGNKHAPVGIINSVLSYILNMSEDNNSIFGRSQGSGIREIRNAIAHSNVFYDSGSKRINLIKGNYITLEEFEKHYFHLYLFVCSWLELSSKMPLENVGGALKLDFKNLLKGFAEVFYKISANHELKMRYYNLVIIWRDESESDKY